MSSGATLVGFEEVIRNLEAKLGDEKVRRSANKALKGAATETLEDFKGALGVYKDTGETIASATVGNVTGSFDYIISNPPIRAGKKVVHQVIEEAYDYLNQGGNLTIVIQKKQGAPSAKAKMEDVFGNAEVVKKAKGYYILRSEKL